MALTLLLEGLSTHAIAEAMGIKSNTAKTYIRLLFLRFRVANRVQLVSRCYQLRDENSPLVAGVLPPANNPKPASEHTTSCGFDTSAEPVLSKPLN